MNGLEFERQFVQLVAEHVEASEMTHADFGRRAFGSEGPRMWRKIRDPQNAGSPRKLTLAEAYQIADALGVEFPTLVWQIHQRVAGDSLQTPTFQ
ncbi:MAG: hypothetical protein ACNI27_11020 [Desulfovibrio sp.]